MGGLLFPKWTDTFLVTYDQQTAGAGGGELSTISASFLFVGIGK
jgi:hypothetical protein